MRDRCRDAEALAQALVRERAADAVGVGMPTQQNDVRLVRCAGEHALEFLTLVRRLTHGDSVAYVSTRAEAQRSKMPDWCRSSVLLLTALIRSGLCGPLVEHK